MLRNQKKLNFIQNELPKLILNYNEDLRSYNVVQCIAAESNHLDGFMSCLFLVDLKLKNTKEIEIQLHLVVKMQSDVDRDKNSFMFINEMFVYKDIIPYFEKFLSTFVTKMCRESWTPRIYFIDSDVNKYMELGSSTETILVMENLKIQNYRLGPRIDLDEAHLKLLIQNIAEFHAVSYALRINQDSTFTKLTENLLPFNFISPDGKFVESQKIIYDYSLERVFDAIDKNEKLKANTKFLENVERFQKTVSPHSMIFMQTFLTTDAWSVITHGDYNRNNVLFQYDERTDHPTKVKMIDFQQVCYASPALDLAFLMYMNINPALRPSIWKSLLQLYHETLFQCLTNILKCEADDSRLAPYKFEKFLSHFSRYAFYGVMVNIMFTPWMASPEDECSQISHLCNTAIHSPELRRLLQMCGGEDVNERVVSAVFHAHEEGYMQIFQQTNK